MLDKVNQLLTKLSNLSVVATPTSLEFVKESVGVPASLVSDTLLRIVYFTVALLGNMPDNGAKTFPVVMLEEPECHVAPLSHKVLAELIKESTDMGNLVVLTTHDPILASHIYEMTDAKVFYFRKRGIVTEVCEVEEPGLFSDMIEGVEEPCTENTNT